MCLHCNQWFHKDELGAHIKNTHAPVMMCHLCGKSYKSAYTLRYHIKMEHTHSEKLQCDKCKLW